MKPISKACCILVIIPILALTGAASLYACPTVAGLVDFNCDGLHRVAITGDSLVKGVGDVAFAAESGYIGRLGTRFSSSIFENLGVSGITSARLLRAYKRNLSKPQFGATKRKTKDLDLILIDVGRNDYWQKQPVAFSVRNIRRLVKYLKVELGKEGYPTPLFIVSTLISTDREFQRPFVEELNALLLRSKSKDLPVELRYDELDMTGRLSDDGLHPNGKGYNAITDLAADYIAGRAQERSSEARPDRDRDGLFDRFEFSNYGTDPALADTDGDGINDGDEVLAGRSPIDPDN